MLTNLEVEILFSPRSTACRRKNVTMLFISHKLNEVKQICDRILVLRDGDQICVNDIDDVDEQDMAKKDGRPGTEPGFSGKAQSGR